MKAYKSLELGIIICALMALIVGVGPGSDRVRAEDPVKIGVLIPLTGASAFGGKKELIGIQIAIDEVNQAGGVLGRKLEIIVEDTESRPKAAMDGIHKLVVLTTRTAHWFHNSSSAPPKTRMKRAIAGSFDTRGPGPSPAPRRRRNPAASRMQRPADGK